MKSEASTSAKKSGETPVVSDAPRLVSVRLSTGDEPTFLRCAAEASCRVFAPTTADPEATRIVEGTPEKLAHLRALLVPVPALREAREDLSQALADAVFADPAPRARGDVYKRPEPEVEPSVPVGATIRVAKEFTFDAAHNLPRYVGKCERLHGHTFKVRVVIDAPIDAWTGLAFDFTRLKAVVDERVIKVLDHTYLNELIPIPTAECIAVWAWDRLKDLPLYEIQIWETPNSFVSYLGPPKAK
jgi:6-pyruvoyltetrahydropterin/6-carboxytetrahydropterin synthase